MTPSRRNNAVITENIPLPLRSRHHWVLWIWEQRVQKNTGELKWTKPPYQPNGASAESDNPATWVSFAEARRTYERGGFSGLGYVVTVDAEATDGNPAIIGDGLAGVDLDHCVDPNTGAVEPWAQAIVEALNSYTEISPSGTGLRIFLYAKLPPKDRKIGNFECYESGRYLTVTGNLLPGTPLTIEHRQDEITAVHTRMFASRNKPRPTSPKQDSTASVDLDDSALLEIAFSARNGAKVRALYEGDINSHGSHSEADLALSSHLAFYTGGDAARVDRLFRTSDLYRPKWDEKRGARTYGENTIAYAIDGTTEFYSPRRSVERVTVSVIL